MTLLFALLSFISTSDDTDDPNALLEMARTKIAAGNRESALLDLGRALAIEPRSPELWRILRALPSREEGWLVAKNDESGTEKRYFGDLDTVMVQLPRKIVSVGSEHPLSLPEERPRRQVTLDAFWIDLFELSSARYEEFVKATGHDAPSGWRGRVSPPVLRDHPVRGLSWDDAVAYARYAKARLRVSSNGSMPRLRKTAVCFAWGDEPFNASLAALDRSLGGSTDPIGSHPLGVSSAGCFDMTGNVWEWCRETFVPYRFDGVPGQALPSTDPPEGYNKCLRGGSFWDAPDLARVTYRSFAGRDRRGDLFGLRIARDVR